MARYPPSRRFRREGDCSSSAYVTAGYYNDEQAAIAEFVFATALLSAVGVFKCHSHKPRPRPLGLGVQFRTNSAVYQDVGSGHKAGAFGSKKEHR